MKKLRFKYLLLGVFALSICSGLQGCKDYDDDIDGLQGQIDELVTKVNSLADLKTQLDNLETTVGSLPYVTDLRYDNGTVYFKVNGVTAEKTFSIPVPATPNTYDIKIEDGKIWLKTNSGAWEAKGTIPVPEIDAYDPAKFTMELSADGKSYILYVDGEATDFTIPVIETESGEPIPTMTFIKDGDTITGVMITIGTESATFLFGSDIATSLVSIPWYVAAHYGEGVNTLNHIVNEGLSSRATPYYEYNKTNMKSWETLSEGWGRFVYRVNPSNIDLSAISIVGFDNERAKMENQTGVRAMASGMTLSTPKMVDGKMVVKVKGKTWHMVSGTSSAANPITLVEYDGTNWTPSYTDEFSLAGYQLDDPYGPASSNSLGTDVMEVDRLALVIKNKDNSEVRSSFAPVKRLVVRQQDLNIGLNKTDLEQATPFTRGNFESLYPLYHSAGYYSGAWYFGDVINTTAGINKFYDNSINATNTGAAWDGYINDYKIWIPVQLDVPFKESTDLKPLIEKYADLWYNNMGRLESQYGQYDLDELGFEDWTFEYALEDYFVGEVNQTTGAPKNDNRPELSYTHLNNGVVSFTPGNTAVIGREPMIRVTLKDDEGQVMMIKLLKLKVYNLRQTPIVVPTDDWGTEVIPCVTSIGWGHEYGAYPAYADRYVDMDQVFVALGMSKEEFVKNYTPAHPTYNPGGIGTTVTYSITCDGVAVTNNLGTSGIAVVDYPVGSAIDYYNRVCINIAPNVKAGKYVVKATFGTQSTVVQHNTVTVVEEFDLTYPENAKLTYKPGMWQGVENMVIYGQPTVINYGPDFLRQGFLENGFTKFELGTECGFLHFELVNPTQYGGQVVIEEVPDPAAGGAIKHRIRIEDVLPSEANNKYVSLMQEDGTYNKVKIRVRAYVTHATAAHTATNRYDIINDATNSTEFDVIFVDPVHYKKISQNYFLRDKAPVNTDADAIYTTKPEDDKGWKVPVYRFFNIYDTWQGESTNGKIWDGNGTGTTGWIATTGVGLRDLHRVKVYYKLDATKNTAFVMANAKVDRITGNVVWNNSGDAVAETGVNVVVTVMLDYDWCPMKQTVADANAKDWYKTFDITIPVKPAATAVVKPTFWYPSTNY